MELNYKNQIITDGFSQPLVSGIDHLGIMRDNGIVSPELYLKLLQAVENPETPYEITVTGIDINPSQNKQRPV